MGGRSVRQGVAEKSRRESKGLPVHGQTPGLHFVSLGVTNAGT